MEVRVIEKLHKQLLLQRNALAKIEERLSLKRSALLARYSYRPRGIVIELTIPTGTGQ